MLSSRKWIDVSYMRCYMKNNFTMIIFSIRNIFAGSKIGSSTYWLLRFTLCDVFPGCWWVVLRLNDKKMWYYIISFPISILPILYQLSPNSSSTLLLLLIPDKSPQLANPTMKLLIKIEPIFLSIPDLQQVIVKGFLSDADILGCNVKLFLDVISWFVVEACVEFTP